MKRMLKYAADSAGLLHLVSRLSPGRVAIFCYHGFRPPGTPASPEEEKLMPVDLFERQLDVFRRYGYPLRLDDFPGAAPPAHDSLCGIVLTVDDGYANFHSLAYPLLLQAGWPATLFLTTGFLDRSTPLWTDWLESLVWRAPDVHPAFRWNGSTLPLPFYARAHRLRFIDEVKRMLKTWPLPQVHTWLQSLERHLGLQYSLDSAAPLLQPLAWDQVRSMHSSGLVSFGSHTVAHPILSRCDPSQLAAELAASRRRIEDELQAPCPCFAYPNGSPADFTPATIDAVREAGYSLAVTMEPGYATSPPIQPLRLRRWGAGISPANLAFLLSGAPALMAS